MTAETSEDAPNQDKPISFKALFLKGSFWAVAGQGAQQVVGLAGNVIVCRLLFPEEMGLMLLVNTVLIGLTMFSDVGIMASVVQNKRGEDPAFLRTAWTVNLLRSSTLWLFSFPVALAVSHFVGEPRLMCLIPVTALKNITGAFCSMSLLVLRRRIEQGRIFLLDLTSIILQVAVMILLAWWLRSVWALVIAAHIVTLYRLAVSHTLLAEGYRMGFEWDRGIAREIFHFGLWIFFSSIMTFLVGRFDVFILGTLLGPGLLGVYGVAKRWALAVGDMVLKISNGVLFPLYSRIAEYDVLSLRRRTLRFRAVVLALALPPLWALSIFGPYVMRIYGQEYADAQWMVRLLSAGAVIAIICQTIEPVLLAMGDSFRHMIQLSVRFCFKLAGLFIGYRLAEEKGLIVGLAMADLLGYPVMACLVRKYNVWLPSLDLAAAVLSAAVIGLGWHLFP